MSPAAPAPPPVAAQTAHASPTHDMIRDIPAATCETLRASEGAPERSSLPRTWANIHLHW